METAIDTLTGKPVQATSASELASTPFRRKFPYWCPCCGQKVIFVPGKAVCAHFKHYAEEDRPDCELYRGGPSALANLALAGHARHSRPFTLVLATDPELTHCRLKVRCRPATEIPKVGILGSEGWLDVPIPSNGRDVYLPLGRMQSSYQMRLGSIEGTFFHHEFQSSVPWFFPARAPLAAAIDAQVLCPGQYIVVSATPLDLPQVCGTRGVETEGEFWAAAFDLPKAMPMSERLRFESVTGRRVEESPVHHCVIIPRAALDSDSDFWEIPSDSEWALALSVSASLTTPKILVQQVQSADGEKHEIRSYPVRPGTTVVLKCDGPLASEITWNVGYQAGGTHGYVCSIRSTDNVARSARPCFHFTRKDKTDCHLYWDSLGLAPALNAVRRRNWALSKLELAPGLSAWAVVDGKRMPFEDVKELQEILHAYRGRLMLHTNAGMAIKVGAIRPLRRTGRVVPVRETLIGRKNCRMAAGAAFGLLSAYAMEATIQ